MDIKEWGRRDSKETRDSKQASINNYETNNELNDDLLSPVQTPETTKKSLQSKYSRQCKDENIKI